MSKERILVIDDEPQIVRLCSRILERDGYEVIAPPFGAEALKAAEGGDYDLLRSDIRMPGISGLELYRRVREKNGGVVAVLITGHATACTYLCLWPNPSSP